MKRILASRNIIIAIGVLVIVFIVFVVVQQTGSGSSDTMPSAERIGPPPQASGDVTPIDTVLGELQRNRTSALRKYRNAPFSAQVDRVTSVGRNGWSSTVSAAGGKVTLYLADAQWQAANPPLAAGQLRTFTCADWRTPTASSAEMYGCGVVNAP